MDTSPQLNGKSRCIEDLSAADISDAAVRSHLGKISSSRLFVNAGRSTRFLQFIVESRLAGNVDRIQEYVLGLEVFGRKESFDPRIDSIVRVEGRRLRLRLQEYYRTDGRQDHLRIELPKRGYIPEFRVCAGTQRRARFLWAASVTAVLLLSGLALAIWTRGPANRGGSEVSPGAVGVLPFDNLSRQPDEEYLADGITDALITELARLPPLHVISRTSMMRHKGSKQSAPAIADKLGARYLLEGTVLRSGRRIRLSVQLIDAPRDSHIWAQSYDRDITDVLRLQSELARQVAREIHIRLAPEANRGVSDAPVVSEKAVEAYLKGRFAHRQRTGEAELRSIAFFEEAIREEPNFALAHAWLAAAYRSATTMGDSAAPEMLPRALAAAKRGVELAPGLSEAHSSLAVSLALEWNWPAAEQEFLRALELSPRDSDAHHRYAILYLAPLGRLQEAEAEIRTAVALDKSSLDNRVILGKILYFQRKYDEASSELLEALTMDPNYADALRNLGAVYVATGRHQEGIALYRKAQSLAPMVWGAGLLAHALAVSGNRRDALLTVRTLVDGSTRNRRAALAIATAYTGLREADEALRWVERARAERDVRLMLLNVDPLYDSLRSHSRFQESVKTFGLSR